MGKSFSFVLETQNCVLPILPVLESLFRLLLTVADKTIDVGNFGFIQSSG